ncbi:MAG: NACHT domain-containing protein [Pedobacter sp.]|nr:MAG: NACHT domain-containing protein [Pedobacter sp.]
MEGTVEQMLLLLSREQHDAVKSISKIRQYIIVSPLQPGHQEAVIPEQRIFDTLQDAFTAQNGQVLLLGAPGSGKTTMLLQFACEVARRCLNDSSKPFPIFRSLYQWDSKTPLIHWAKKSIQDNFPEVILDNRSIIYILDGLDELGGERLVDPSKPKGDTYDPRITFLDTVSEKSKMQAILADLTKAEDSMNDWMHKFEPDYSNKPHEEVVKYMTAQEASITHVDSVTKAAIKASWQFLAKHKK